MAEASSFHEPAIDAEVIDSSVIDEGSLRRLLRKAGRIDVAHLWLYVGVRFVVLRRQSTEMLSASFSNAQCAAKVRVEESSDR